MSNEVGPAHRWTAENGRTYGLDDEGNMVVRCEDEFSNPYWRPPTDGDIDRMGGSQAIVMGPEMLRLSARKEAPWPADTERLDLLDRLSKEGGLESGVILRRSETGRGWRLHQTPREGASRTVREAIDRFVDEEYEARRDEEYGQPPGEPGKEG